MHPVFFGNAACRARKSLLLMVGLIAFGSLAHAQAPRLEYLPKETAGRLCNAQGVNVEMIHSFSAKDEKGVSGDITGVELPLREEVERLCVAVGLKPMPGQSDVTLRVYFHAGTRATSYRVADKRELFYASARFSAGSSVLLDGKEVQYAAWSHEIDPPDSMSDSPVPLTSPSVILPRGGLPDPQNAGAKRVFIFPTKPESAPFMELLPEFRRGVLTTLAGMRGVDAIVRLLRTGYADEAGAWLKSARGRAVEPLLDALEGDQSEVRAKALNLLKEITGEKHSTPKDWREWWEQSKNTFPPGF